MEVQGKRGTVANNQSGVLGESTSPVGASQGMELCGGAPGCPGKGYDRRLHDRREATVGAERNDGGQQEGEHQEQQQRE